MADLRCPMCSKLNPDTLDVCQFCGARLKPLVLPPTSALQLPDDWGKPKAADEPAKEADDWLASLRQNEARDEAEASQAETGADEPASTDGSDWLANLRAQDEAAPAPDPYTPPLPRRTGGTDWLGSLRKATDELPSWLAEPIEPEADKDENWLREAQGGIEERLGPTTEPPTDSALPPWLAAPSEPAAPPAPAPSAPEPEPEPELPPWMAGAQPEPPAAPSALPDWMSGATGSTDETIVRRPPPAPAPTPAPTPDLPDWLTGGADSSAELPAWMQSPPAPSEDADDTLAIPPSELPAWMQSATAAPEPAAPAPSAADDDTTLSMSTDELPDWLKSEPGPGGPVVEPPAPKPITSELPEWLGSPTPTIPEPPPVVHSSDKSVVGITDWFADSEPPPAAEPSLTDWLKGSSPPAAPTGEPPSDRPVLGVTDWLSSVGSQPPSTDRLEWLKSPDSPDAATATPSKKGGTTDFLNSLEPPAPPKKGGTTDFLNSLEPPAPPKKGGTTDFLNSLEPPKPGTQPLRPGGTGWLGSAPGELPPDAKARPTPASELPSWLKEIQPPGAGPVDATLKSGSAVNEVTDWLATSESMPPPPPKVDESGKAVVGSTDWFKSITSGASAKTGQTGWLGAATGDQPAAQPPAPSGAIFGATDWLTELAASAPKAGEAPPIPPAEPPAAPAAQQAEWLAPTPEPTPGTLPDWAKPETPPAEPASASGSGPALIGTTDWLKSLGTDKLDLTAISKRKNDVSDLDWLQRPTTLPQTPPLTDSAGTPPRLGHTAPFAVEKPAGAELPPWLAALKPQGAEDVPTGAPPAAPPAVTAPPPVRPTPALAAEDLPEWMQPGAPAPTAPAASADETIVRRPSAPAVSPAVTTAAPTVTRTRPAEAAPAKAVPAFTMPISAEAGDISTAQLPGWLNALRPLDARATAREPDPDREEAVGPLAGMRGILPAESVISGAGIPGASVVNFVLTDSQARLADNLRRLVQEEAGAEAEIKPRKKSRLNFSFSRLIVALALLAVVLLPYAIGPLLFTPPTAATHPLQTAIEALPTDRPVVVLMAMEYEPAYSGELSPAVQSVMVHLLTKGARLVTLSTTPAGAGLAQNLLARSATEAGLEPGDEGSRYLNLGYLPGSTAGLRAFATDPLTAVTADFYGEGQPFEREVLTGFTGLGNLDMIIVATASADTLRHWIEQVPGQRMAAITSAAAAPLAAPYASGGEAPLFATLTGLSGSIQYDQATGRNTAEAQADLAARQWSAYGLGLYAGAGILVAGGLLSIVSLIMSRRPAPSRAAAKPKAAARPKRKAAPAPAPEPEPLPEATVADTFGDTGTFGESDFGSTASLDDTWVSAEPAAETIVATKKKTGKAPAGKKANGKGKTTAGKGAGKTKARPEAELDPNARPSKPKIRKV